MNKQNKGFTLIELLAVIVILAIIILITTAVVSNIVDNSKRGALQASSYGIIKTAEQSHSILLMKNGNVGLTEVRFENGEKVEQNGDVQLNYKGDNPQFGNIIITDLGFTAIAFYQDGYCALKNFDQNTVETIKKKKEDCIIEILEPIIVFTGNETVNVEIKTEYKELGVKIYDEFRRLINSYETEIKKDGKIETTIDTSILGEYQIRYFQIIEGTELSIIRTVKIVDTTNPVLIVPEDTTISDSQVATYDLLEGVEVSDNSGEIIEIQVTSNLIAEVGEYEIIYKATDSSGNEIIKTRIITVEQRSMTYNYNGSPQEVVLQPGRYLFKLWGAKGSNGTGNLGGSGGNGGYSEGITVINEVTTIYIYIGGTPVNKGDYGCTGGYNGGGSVNLGSGGTSSNHSGCGGGATDIRIGSDLASRIMVAGGGGGGAKYAGGGGGGVTGEFGRNIDGPVAGTAGTQTSGNALGTGCNNTYFKRAAGGGGYYGGKCTPSGSYKGAGIDNIPASGGGGSGFVPGHPGVLESTNGFTFTDTVITANVNNGVGKITIEKLD
ncbi:MAG: glycine-rich protein [Bacilli bacterium]|nr:glycine-rich protein [Bacilli bacterium]MDD4282383.1 glycine-rich protein [Bacilli bacterium]MDD4718990.1 glycine-rich protein [Bacilli bacterium]